MDRWMTTGMVAVAVIVVLSVVGSLAVYKTLGPLAVPLTFIAGLGVSLFLLTLFGPRAWRAFYKFELALLVWHTFRGLW
jgi:hypothetical protein